MDLIPKIAFVEFHLVPLEESTELVLEGHFAVMLFLRNNISSNFLQIRFTD